MWSVSNINRIGRFVYYNMHASNRYPYFVVRLYRSVFAGLDLRGGKRAIDCEARENFS